MNRLSAICVILIGIWVFSGCSSPKVITYAHANADFERYKTFQINPHTKIKELSRKGHETYQRLDTLIVSLLKSKGYQYTIDPDLVVEYEISTGLSQDTPNQNYNRYSYSWYYPNYSYSAPPQDIEAMIEIEMIEQATKKTVWTGSADLKFKTRGNDNVERIEQHIIEIFNRFEYTPPN